MVPAPEERTASKHLQEAVEGTPENPSRGVKGPSIVMELPRFDIVAGFIPDYMHCACLGVLRQLFKLWLDSEHHLSAWYIGTRVASLNKLLLALCPPVEITRTPRKFEERSYWKASELRAFILFYGYVVLKPVLPRKYFKHYVLFAYGIYLLVQKNVSKLDICHSRALLETFVMQIGRLYEKQHMSFNVHQLVHLVDSVEAWGPLWATSCFPFEGKNAVLLSYISGTRGVAEQIATKFLWWQNVMAWEEKQASEKAGLFLGKMLSRKTIGRTGICLPEGVIAYKMRSSAASNLRFEVALENLLGTVPSVVTYYHRFQSCDTVWCSESYTMPKRVNC
ncbi:unnamed protein product, partial [Ixodes pacificus]